MSDEINDDRKPKDGNTIIKEATKGIRRKEQGLIRPKINKCQRDRRKIRGIKGLAWRNKAETKGNSITSKQTITWIQPIYWGIKKQIQRHLIGIEEAEGDQSSDYLIALTKTQELGWRSLNFKDSHEKWEHVIIEQNQE